MWELGLICIVASFFLRTLAHMVNYSLQYGQIFGFIKLLLCAKILGIDRTIAFNKINQSDNEEISHDYYDMACEVKYNEDSSIKLRFLSYLFSLMDCVYCIGFWLSLITSIILVIIGYDWTCIIYIPILSYFMIEKI